MRAYRRSEGADDETLSKTFVSTPPLEAMLCSPQHQSVYGRRGTGKTHVLSYLTNTERGSASSHCNE
ncbi:ORC-CDC6 family AAA ATPase [Mycobacterium montefiorense]|uniref:ORC-CDC6 family AAA ATPase n=1 Tax=Mycobacterium montefiorense TaxID=154654 RepID=UPI003B8A68F1